MTLDELLFAGIGSVPCLSSYGIDNFVEVGDQVKLILDDVCIREFFLHYTLIGTTSIDANGAYAFLLFG